MEEATPRLLQGPLVVDSAFSTEQKEAVLEAVDLWRGATAGTFDPALVVGEVECGQAFAIEAVAQQGCRVGQRVSSGPPEQRVLGAVDRFAHTVAVVSWLTGSRFRDNVAHELGHYLLLGHGEGIMAQQREGALPFVSAASLREFCAIWGCPSGPQCSESR